MKKQAKNKFRGTKFQAVPKHRRTSAFHSVNSIAPVVLDRVPSYNTQGKEYERILPPMRNQKIIDTRLLAYLINKKTPGNLTEVIPDGIRLNQVEIKISEGIADFKKMKFRFNDLWDLVMNFKQEGILICSIQDIRTIKYHYFKNLSEPET